MPRLLVYQAIWGMENLPGVDMEADMPGVLAKIFAAGFDGVGVSLMRPERAEVVAKGVHDHGKGFEAIGFVWTAADVARYIDRAQELGAHHLNVQIMARPDKVDDAVALLTEFEAEASNATIPVHYETHRGRLTNDALFTCRILDRMPTLRLTGDLSHYPLVHEMPLPVPEPDMARMRKVLKHCYAFHGRVPGSHQIQVSLKAPQHQGWVDQMTLWWREGFADWLTRAGPDGELMFMPELGPPNYAITGLDGLELSDRWEEALMLKDIARALWAEVTEPVAA
ncbi:MAG: hypothetical protein U1C74_31745 [Phenylobacterium sp.]|nr:hypothetical protein [Phenylobacterium sp.]